MENLVVKKGDTLSGLAQQYGTTVSAFANANSINNPNLINIGQVLKIPKQIPSTVLSSPVVPITPPQIQPTQPINFDTTQTKNDAKTYVDSLTGQLNQAENDRNSANSLLSQLMGETTNKAVDTNNAYERSGINSLISQINDYTGQITALDNMNQAEQLSVGQRVGGITQNDYTKEQGRIDRNNAIKKLSISASLAAVQGKYNTSKALADRAIEAQYAPKEARIKMLQDWLKNNEYDLTRLDNKNYKKQELELKKEENKLAVEKEMKSQTMGIIKDLMSNGQISSQDGSKFIDQITGSSLSEMFDMYGIQDSVNTNKIKDTSGLSTGDLGRLNTVISKYSADEIVKQSQQVPMIQSIVKTVRDNPNSASNQLITLYTLVKNLDPNSAVREGELDLATKTNSFFGKYEDSLARLSKGRVLNPKATLELINGIETLSKEWEKSGKRKINQYQSQANVLGLGSDFTNYIVGYDSLNQSQSGGTSVGRTTKGGLSF